MSSITLQTDAAAPVVATAASGPTAEEFAERLGRSALGCGEIFAVYLGDRLGWYRSLAEHGPSTADELAAHTATSPRYAREWLEQQAVTGILFADVDATTAATRRFTLPAGTAEALNDRHSLAYMSPLARVIGAVRLDLLLEAYRTGGGVSWQQLGADAREGQAEGNRPWFEQLPAVFAGADRIHSVLSRPGARVADVGMGGGWSSIAIATGYPGVTVDGFDVDEESVALARANAEAAGVADRVRFHLADGDTLEQHGPFDAVFAFECIHDMSHPVDVLRAMRRSVKDDGIVIIMDEAVGERFGDPDAELDPTFYMYSLFVCLPDGLSDQPSAATGTVMRPDTLREYAQAAGFAEISVPIESFGLWRFYDLHFDTATAVE